MNPTPVALSLTSTWRGKSPGLAELGTLLNMRPEPSIILDINLGKILLVNSALLKLTAFALNELAIMTISDIFSGLSLEPIALNEKQKVNIYRRSRSPLPVTIQLNHLDPNGKWLLVTIIPESERVDEIHQKREEAFAAMTDMARIYDQPDLDSALLKSLENCRLLLGANLACIYQNDGGFPRLVKKLALEPQPLLPESIPSSDLVKLSDIQIWMPGKRMVTELHRVARVTELSYLASIPLGNEGAFLGLLVVGDNSRQPKQRLGEMLKILGAHITSTYQHFLLTENLNQVNATVQNLLNIRNAQVENAQEAILVLTPELKISEINPAAEWMFGYVNQEVVDQQVENILIGSESLMPALEGIIRGCPPPNIGIISLHRRNGESFPAEIEMIPLQKNGQMTGLLVFVTDVSESENFRKRTQQLENRATLGDFISMFAHEVRNPVNNISTGLQLLSICLKPDDPNQGTINRMQNDCSRLNHLMEDILAWNRQTEPRFEKVNLSVFIRSIIDRWRPRFINASVTPIFQPADNMQLVKADPRMLDQVFVNLISNATEAMSKTGGTLTIRIAPCDAIANLPQVEVTVSDDGPGIPDDVRDHIFEPFFTTKTRGTGLGLSIIKRIVTAHHGNISVDSCPGGTVFHIYLPAV